MEKGEHEVLFEQAVEVTRSMPTYTRKAALVEQITALQNEAAKLRPPPLPVPDPSGKSYPVFVPRKGMNPIEHLRTQWGQWLQCFNDERPEGEKLDQDYVFRQQLMKLDPKLLPNLGSHLQREPENSQYYGLVATDFVKSIDSVPPMHCALCMK